MAYFEEGSEAMVALEGMVDKAGLRNVLFALAHICGAKAEHVAVNWQDTTTARGWENRAKHVSSLAAHTAVD